MPGNMEAGEVITSMASTKGKSCLTKLVAFYDNLTVAADKGRAIYMDFSKTFVMVPPQHPSLLIRKIRNWWVGCLMVEEVIVRSYPESVLNASSPGLLQKPHASH